MFGSYSTVPGRSLRALSLLILVLLLVSPLVLPAAPVVQAQGTIIYVAPGGTGDGSSWATATALQTALSQATSGTEIWLADGTYTPGGARTDTFTIPSGVALYGGFDGVVSEAALSDRDLSLFNAILDGNNNNYTVVTINGGNADTRLDGLFIINGNADNSGSADPAETNGGGIFMSSSTPQIANVTFAGNSAFDRGGGLFTLLSAPTFVNVVFTGNSAANGGALATSFNGIGGAIPTITNATFSNNTATTAGLSVSTDNGSTPQVQNSIFWNTAGLGGLTHANGTPTINNSIVQGGQAGMNNVDADPTFVDADGADNTVGTVDDNVRLLADRANRSPAIDTADNTVLPAGVMADRDGNARQSDFPPVPNNPSILDKGAYEFVNKPPSGITLSNNLINETDEQTLPGFDNTPVGTFSTQDPDNVSEGGEGDSHVYQITQIRDGLGTIVTTPTFELQNNNQLVPTRGFNFEEPADQSFIVTVQTTDTTSLDLGDNNPVQNPIDFTITITNVNEQSTDIGLSNDSIAENLPAGTTVGMLTTTDSDIGDTFTYSLVGGAGSGDNFFFQISGNELQTAAMLNFEERNPSVYSVRIRSTDAGGRFTEKQFTITVTDEPDAAFAISLTPPQARQISEDRAPSGTVPLGTLSPITEQPDAPYTFAFIDNENYPDNAAFQLGEDPGNIWRLFFVDDSTLDFETKQQYVLRIQVTGNSGTPFAQDLIIGVTNINEQPTGIALSNNTLSDQQVSGFSVGTLSTTDPDTTGPGNEGNDSFTYTLLNDAGGNFVIGGASNNEIILNVDMPAAGDYPIEVQSTDSGGLTTTQMFTIVVSDGNLPPTSVAGQVSGSLPQDLVPAGTTVATLTTQDPDGESETFTYQLVAGEGDTNNGLFEIVGNELRSTQQLFPGTYTVRVRSTDSENNTVEGVVTFQVEGAFRFYAPFIGQIPVS